MSNLMNEQSIERLYSILEAFGGKEYVMRYLQTAKMNQTVVTIEETGKLLGGTFHMKLVFDETEDKK
jgi:hypothetical protein